MKVIVVLHILPVDGTLVQDHHVGKQPVKQVVHRPGHLLQHIRQAAPLRPVKIAEGGFVAVADDEHTVGIIGEKGKISDKMVVLGDDSSPEGPLLPVHVANEAGTLPLVIFAAILQLGANLQGHVGIGVDLTVGMEHRHPAFLPPVLKDEHILMPRILAQFDEAFRPKIDQLLDVIHGKLRKGGGVAGGIKDHFAFAHRLAGPVEGRTHRIGLRRIRHQRGKIVVVRVNVVVLRNFPRSRTKGTIRLRQMGPVFPIGSHHRPIVQKGIVAQFHRMNHPPLEFPGRRRPSGKAVPYSIISQEKEIINRSLGIYA